MKRRREFREIYRKSLANLLYLNDYYKKVGQNEYRQILLEPRRCHRNVFLINVAVWVMYIFFPLMVLCKAIKIIRKRNRYNISNINYLGKIFIDTTPSVLHLLHKANIETNSITWLSYDRCSQIQEGKQILYSDLISNADILLSIIDSVISYYSSIVRYGKVISFTGVSIFEWFVEKNALLKIPEDKEILFCHQLDPLAILIDNLPNKNKTLIQHGTVVFKHNVKTLDKSFFPYNEEFGFWTYNMPVKFQSLTKIYSFSRIEYEALLTCMCDCKPNFVETGYSLKISPIKGNKFKLLIIGYYKGYGDKEEKVLDCLKNVDLTIILKNHPTQDVNEYGHLLDKYSFEIVNEQIFPDADVIISYESTLALEYKSIGKRVIYYDEISWESFKDEIIELMKKRV